MTLSRRTKSAVFSLVLLLFLLLCVELVVRILYPSIGGIRYSKKQIKALIKQQMFSLDEADEEVMAGRMFRFDAPWPEAIHPYVGYVPDPRRVRGVNQFGFWGTNSPIRRKSADTRIVGLMGGSFAYQLAEIAGNTLCEALSDPARPAQLVNLAHGGYKQPQQLMILAFLLSLGAEFDLVINLDGFNEIALPKIENLPGRVFPFYPRSWWLRSRNFVGMEDTNKKIGYIAYLREKRALLARNSHNRRLYRSPTLSLFWMIADRKLEHQLLTAHGQLDELYEQKKRNEAYVTTGPSFPDTSDDVLFEALADNWLRCSLELKALCDAFGARYVHVLQPNQYVENSKPLSPEERAIAYNNESPYRECVLKGYPRLQAKAKALETARAEFHDFTGVFSNIHESMYMDTCCHLTTNGYYFLAREIGRRINAAKN